MLWLTVFFVVPLGFLAYQSLQSGNFDVGYSFSWAWGNYWHAVRDYRAQFIRSLEYAGIATLLALVVSYPVAYWIAFRGGRWKNLLLLFIVAPFFVTYLIRTLAWQTILEDHGFVVNTLQNLHVLGSGGRLLATGTAVVAGITYNFLPFMALPLYVSLEQVDPRLIEAAEDLYANKIRAFLRVTLPLSLPGVVAGTLLTFIPAAGGCDVVHSHGCDPRLRRGLRVHRRYRAVDRDSPLSAVAVQRNRPRRSVLASVWAFVKRNVLTVYSILFFIYLMLPIAVVVVFSFNNPVGKFNYTWQGFTWNNWRYWNGVPGIQSAITLSLEIALIASLVATALGTMIALALVRYRFRTRAATNILIFLPLSTPEIVLGASLLTLFLNVTFFPFGFWTILIAHVMFCISFAVVTVKARLIGFDRHLEEAAMDLGANEFTTFRKVTLPLITPAVLAAFLLCFAISVDDFVVTYFNSGSSVTFPIYVWGAARIGAPAQVNVIGTAIFVIAISAALANVLIQMRREKR